MRFALAAAVLVLVAGCAAPTPPTINTTPAPQGPATAPAVWLEINETALRTGGLSGWLHVNNPTAGTSYTPRLLDGPCGLLEVDFVDVETGQHVFAPGTMNDYDCAFPVETDQTVLAIAAGRDTALPFTSWEYEGIVAGHHYAATVIHRPGGHNVQAVTLPIWPTVLSATAITQATQDVPRHHGIV